MSLQQKIWERTVAQPILKTDEIHVWRVFLNGESVARRDFIRLLSRDEICKAENYYSEKDKNYSMITRGVLRKLLGGYLNLSPEEISFSYNRYGKPMLDNRINNKSLCFNVSHSQGLTLIAVTNEEQIGVDVEFVNENFNLIKVGASFFSATEMSELKSLAPHLQTSFFYTVWTRKEAYIKGLGIGLSFPVKKITVSVAGENFEMINYTDSSDKNQNWFSMSLPVEQNYRSAVAVKGKPKKVRYWQYQ